MIMSAITLTTTTMMMKMMMMSSYYTRSRSLDDAAKRTLYSPTPLLDLKLLFVSFQGGPSLSPPPVLRVNLQASEIRRGDTCDTIWRSSESRGR